jgi:hypothetical protein
MVQPEKFCYKSPASGRGRAASLRLALRGPGPRLNLGMRGSRRASSSAAISSEASRPSGAGAKRRPHRLLMQARLLYEVLVAGSRRKRRAEQLVRSVRRSRSRETAPKGRVSLRREGYGCAYGERAIRRRTLGNLAWDRDFLSELCCRMKRPNGLPHLRGFGTRVGAI